jgi:hypothetical protein
LDSPEDTGKTLSLGLLRRTEGAVEAEGGGGLGRQKAREEKPGGQHRTALTLALLEDSLNRRTR